MQLIRNSENINTLWANLIVEELIRHKIDYFCISPGSRSTPLTIAAARHPKVKTKIFYDERGAGFHALGYARSSKKPAVLVCTSGTAAANYYPAVIEAAQENIPMLIFSADRPPELRKRGANQTIDQVNLFGKYTRLFFDFPCPNVKNNASFVISHIDKAVLFSIGINPGPVHLNFMFREPLAPKTETWSKNYLDKLSSWLSSEKAYTINPVDFPDFSTTDLNSVCTLIDENPLGLILAGRNEDLTDQQAILRLSKKLCWPVFADITSGLRFNPSENIIHYFDQLLLSETIISKLKHLAILHFGGQFVSKRLLPFLENHQGKHIHILETDKIIDPAKNVSLRIQHPINSTIEKVLLNIDSKNDLPFFTDLKSANQKIKTHFEAFDSRQKKVNEISVARIISQNIFPDSALFLASSMPIRDMDMFITGLNKDILIGSNRGASGIDGTIASSTGFALGAKRAITLIIGDIAFIHDINSLSLLENFEFAFTIILINNQGGGIFSFLPIAEYEDVFEENFATPHKLTFIKAAEMFGLDYFSPKSIKDLRELYISCQQGKRKSIIEIKTDRKENFELHKKQYGEIKNLL